MFELLRFQEGFGIPKLQYQGLNLFGKNQGSTLFPGRFRKRILWRRMRSFFMKMRGEGKSPPRVLLKEVLVSWVGAFLGIFAVGFLGHLVHLEQQDILFLIGSFGASVVLLYGTPGVPLAQPRNLMGGHILSALTGVLMYGWIAEPLYLSVALSVATAIAVMHLTKTTHPPGGATALIAVIGSERVHQLGFLYVLSPVALGALIMLVVALTVNNLISFRRYPVFWW